MVQKDRTLGKQSPNWEGSFQIINVFSNNAYEVKELGPDERTMRINDKYLKKNKPTLQEILIIEEKCIRNQGARMTLKLKVPKWSIVIIQLHNKKRLIHNGS